jgi:GT2 family glycosyltransferase
MNSLPKTGIITLNWRHCQDTIECIESLLKQDYPDFHIFILENGSGDGSAEALEEWGKARLGNDFLSVTTKEAEKKEGLSLNKRIVLIKSDENLGFAGGNNLLIRMAIQIGARFFWLINNDTVQDKNALTALVKAAQSDEKAGMVCSKVFYYNKPDMIESVGSTLIIPFGVFRHIRQRLNASDLPSKLMNVPYVYGCSFLVSVELINDIGLMDERYFLLREESDWNIRARRRGWNIYSAPDSVVWHKVTSSMGKRSEIFFYYVTRNTLLFMREHYPLFLPVTIFSMLPLVTGLIFVDNLFSERKNMFSKLKMVALGYIHFFNGKLGRLKVNN